MRKQRTLYVFLALLAALTLAACSAPVQDTSAEVEAAVAATLTVVASSAETGPATAEATPTTKPTTPPDTPTPTQAAQSQPQAEAPTIVLPPQVANFAPAPVEAKSMGDPDAPVVIYEWSDYT